MKKLPKFIVPAQFDDVPIECTMSSDELEEYMFLSIIDDVNSELQILAEMDKSENDIT